MRALTSLVFGALALEAVACAHSDPNDGMLKEYAPLPVRSEEEEARRARPPPEPGAAWHVDGSSAPEGTPAGGGAAPVTPAPKVPSPSERSSSTVTASVDTEIPPDEDWLGDAAGSDDEGTADAGEVSDPTEEAPEVAEAADAADDEGDGEVAVAEPAGEAGEPPAEVASAPPPAEDPDAAALLSVKTIGGKRCVVELCGESLGAPPVEEREVPTGKHNVVVRCGRKVSELHPVVLRPGVAEALVIDMRKGKGKKKHKKKKKPGHLAHR